MITAARSSQENPLSSSTEECIIQAGAPRMHAACMRMCVCVRVCLCVLRRKSLLVRLVPKFRRLRKLETSKSVAVALMTCQRPRDASTDSEWLIRQAALDVGSNKFKSTADALKFHKIPTPKRQNVSLHIQWTCWLWEGGRGLGLAGWGIATVNQVFLHFEIGYTTSLMHRTRGRLRQIGRTQHEK